MNICIDNNGTIQPLFPICDTMVDSDMLDDADKTLIGTEYPDHGSSYSKLTDALQDLISTDCCGIYAPQTKILEGRTNISECVFEALFKGVSTGFGLRNVEKCFENAL